MLEKTRRWIGKKNHYFSKYFNQMEESFVNSKSGKRFFEMRLPMKNISQKFETFIKKKYENALKDLDIRIAEKKDLESLKNLYNTAWSTATMPYNPINISTLSNAIKNPDIFILIASLSSIDIGFIILKIETNHKKIGHIVGIGLLTEYRHRGFGTVLGIVSWDHFKEKKVEELRCKVFSENKIASSFMRGLGFEEDLSITRTLHYP